jgi:hypothetical protein
MNSMGDTAAAYRSVRHPPLSAMNQYRNVASGQLGKKFARKRVEEAKRKIKPSKLAENIRNAQACPITDQPVEVRPGAYY